VRRPERERFARHKPTFCFSLIIPLLDAHHADTKTPIIAARRACASATVANEVVCGIDFHRRRDECFGVLGPDCAVEYGRPFDDHLLLSAHADISRPASGHPGESLRDQGAASVWHPEENLIPTQRRDNLVIYATYFGGPASGGTRRFATLLAVAALSDKREARNRHSVGRDEASERLILARALVNRKTELLVLDDRRPASSAGTAPRVGASFAI